MLSNITKLAFKIQIRDSKVIDVFFYFPHLGDTPVYTKRIAWQMVLCLAFWVFLPKISICLSVTWRKWNFTSH